MSLAEQIAGWIRTQVEGAGLDGAVVGLSGGVDSAVVSGLSARAVGPSNVLGVGMPCHSGPEDLADAELAARTWGIDYRSVDLSAQYDAFIRLLLDGTDLANANIKPRLRMITLYHHANSLNRMVVGTGNKSELMVGYFTKYGDGGVDILPLGGLLKVQVRELARELGVPQRVINRAPSAGLWAGQTDEDELGITYEELDTTLAAIDAGDTSAVDSDLLERVQHMIAASEHKRRLAPVFVPEVSS